MRWGYAFFSREFPDKLGSPLCYPDLHCQLLPYSVCIFQLYAHRCRLHHYHPIPHQNYHRPAQVKLVWVEEPNHFTLHFTTSSLTLRLFFTTKLPEILGTDLIDLGRMKGWVELEATQWFSARESSTLITRPLVHNFICALGSVNTESICLNQSSSFDHISRVYEIFFGWLLWILSLLFVYENYFLSVHKLLF